MNSTLFFKKMLGLGKEKQMQRVSQNMIIRQENKLTPINIKICMQTQIVKKPRGAMTGRNPLHRISTKLISNQCA